MLDHAREVASVGKLEDDVELVVLDEGGEVLDYVGVVQLLQQLDLLHAVQPRLVIDSFSLDVGADYEVKRPCCPSSRRFGPSSVQLFDHHEQPLPGRPH